MAEGMADDLSPSRDEHVAALLAGFLEDVSRRVAGALPHVAGVAVTMGGKGVPLTLGANNELAADVDRIQIEIGQGPCLHALTTGEGMYVADLAADDRWGEYGPRAAERGARSCISVPVAAGGETVAVLKFYSGEVDGLSDVDQKVAVEAAREVAGGFGVARHLARQAGTIGDLESAMASRRPIDIAIGIVMERASCGPDEAFSLLRQQSQNGNVKLRDLAVEVATQVAGEPLDLTAPFAEREA